MVVGGGGGGGGTLPHTPSLAFRHPENFSKLCRDWSKSTCSFAVPKATLAVTTGMISARRWAALRAILMFSLL